MKKNGEFMFLTLITLALILSVSFSAYSYNDNNPEALPNEKEWNSSYNEYELLKEINAEYQLAEENNSLNSNDTFNGLSEDELNFIKNYTAEYAKKIYELKEWEIEKLKNTGYKDEQIVAIKAFDGSKEMLIAAATQYKVNLNFSELNHTTSGTTVKLTADFNVYGIPSNSFKDIFAVMWSSPLMVVSNKAKLRYMNDKGYSYTVATGLDYNLYARSMAFTKYSTTKSGYYIHSGSITVNLKSNTTAAYDGVALAAYGRTSININPSVSFLWKSNISFGTGTTNIAEDYASFINIQ